MADQLATVKEPLPGQWVNAIDLRVGQLLRTSAGTWTQITEVDTRIETATVYNLTVAGVHTYYVAAADTDLLTHNDGGPCETFYRTMSDLSYSAAQRP